MNNANILKPSIRTKLSKSKAIFLLFFALFSLALFLPTPAKAASFEAGRIIDDSIFVNKNSMSVADIQNFLNSKVPTCNRWHAGFTGSSGTVYSPPWTCLKEYNENPITKQNNIGQFNPDGSPVVVPGGLSAAQIIWNAAQTYSINPQVILVTLQKETGLITDDWAASWQYRTAMGFGCPDGAPCDAQWFGFANQVAQGTRHFRNFFDGVRSGGFWTPTLPGVNTIGYNPNSACGSSSVNITTRAAAALYSYTPYQPNAAALNNLYGTGDACSAYGNRNFWRDFTGWFGSTYDSQILLAYKAYLGGTGWTAQKTNSGVIGTTGESRSLEAFKINGSVEYNSYSNERGWQPIINSGMISGTLGQNRATSAIKINPTGIFSDIYDVWYRVHVGGIGWMGWTKNNGVAGYLGDATKKIEAIEIAPYLKSVPFYGDTATPSSIGTAPADVSRPVSLNILSHISSIGWQPTVSDGMISGTTEQSRRLEAINISLINNTGLAGDIVYSAHVQSIGWQDFKSGGQVSGTTGKSLRTEAIRAALVGEVASQYTLWYRGYIENYGWMEWTNTGGCAGSSGLSLRLEAVEFRLSPINNSQGLNKSQKSCLDPMGLSAIKDHTITYSSHLSNLGWTTAVGEGSISGTTGQSRPLEALSFKTINSVFGSINIECSANVRGLGWANYVTANNTCGTTGQSRPIEAIKLRLTGVASYLYNIKYKVHVSGIGWMDWVTNDSLAGVIGQSKNIEAVIVMAEVK